MVTMTKIELEDCQKACLQQDTFHCRSIDYNRAAKTCYLQSVTRLV
jgi:hypothetical protein